MQHILDLETQQLDKYLYAQGIARYRLSQIVEWVYKKSVRDFDECTNLPGDLKGVLKKEFFLRAMKLDNRSVSRLDGTIRYNFVAHDGLRVSAVYLPAGEKNSVCISTQIGCPVSCRFCASGRIKFMRNLTRGEILEQVLHVENDTGKKVSGILLMGMGEPMFNYSNVVSALKVMSSADGFAVGRRHVIVSTSGVVPAIKKLSKEGIGVRLAISLHAPEDDVRKKLIPEIVPYTIQEILNAAFEYSNASASRLTLEYVMLSGVNDSLISARKLLNLIRNFSSNKEGVQVNLIPYNASAGPKYTGPGKDTILNFRNLLVKGGLVATVREPRGTDIQAACGQLGVE